MTTTNRTRRAPRSSFTTTNLPVEVCVLHLGTLAALRERAADAAAGITVPGDVLGTPENMADAVRVQRARLDTDAAFEVLRAAVERRAVALARLDAIRAEQVAAVAEFEAATAATVVASDAYSASVAH
jgi:hypothetical protein